jgi:hypothetical protein
MRRSLSLTPHEKLGILKVGTALEAIQEVVHEHQVNLLVFDPATEEIVQW